jgi:hypothetical protein
MKIPEEMQRGCVFPCAIFGEIRIPVENQERERVCGGNDGEVRMKRIR